MLINFLLRCSPAGYSVVDLRTERLAAVSEGAADAGVLPVAAWLQSELVALQFGQQDFVEQVGRQLQQQVGRRLQHLEEGKR